MDHCFFIQMYCFGNLLLNSFLSFFVCYYRSYLIESLHDRMTTARVYTFLATKAYMYTIPRDVYT